MAAPRFFDTHCHVHELEVATSPMYSKWQGGTGPQTAKNVLEAARHGGVTGMIAIGATLADSERAVQFAQNHDTVWAAIGLHPHEAKNYITPQKLLREDCPPKVGLTVVGSVVERFGQLARESRVVAVGECGLDYFYGHSSPAEQEAVLRFQIELALEHKLPLSFHVRSGASQGRPRHAYTDFWRIFDSYRGVRGVLHSFTDTPENLARALERGLYIGVNGIATFTRDETQLVTYRTIPQHSLLLETDAPFLTPKPFRGKVCEPKHVVHTAEFLAALRGETLTQLAASTLKNGQTLFNHI